MAVPKMAKNGQNSRLHASAGFDKDSAQRNQEQTRSPKPSLDHEGRIKTILHQFQNKNARLVQTRLNRISGTHNQRLLQFSCGHCKVVTSDSRYDDYHNYDANNSHSSYSFRIFQILHRSYTD
jgi:hypothetical protein